MTKDTTVRGRLRSRIMLFVTLTMVPIGLIGVVQNRQLTTLQNDRAQAVLIADSQIVALQDALAWRDGTPPSAEGP